MDGEIAPEELSTLLDEDPPRIVDIRDRASFSQGHVPGSENVPFGRLPGAIPRYDDADRVVTVCYHGEASVRAARLFEAHDGTGDTVVESLAGGIEAWTGPLETGSTDGEDGDEPTDPEPPF